MPYKENCKVEGEIITRLKVARLYFSCRKTQKEIAENIRCHYNTINSIIKTCKCWASDEAMRLLRISEKITSDKLSLFEFLKSASRRPKSNRRSLKADDEDFILEKHEKRHYGYKRLFKHLDRKGYDTKNIFTLGKIKGVYKRNNLKAKKIRTANGERRALYDYDEIEAFEYLQYDTKEIPDKHSLPEEIYQKFKYGGYLPKYQWTIVDAKSKTRFLAWSYALTSFFGLKFLEFVITWLRAHNIRVRIHTQIDGGSEMCSASKKKLKDWNERLAKYNVEVYDTEGASWKQNLVERTHRTDDEEFYCPRGEFINTKSDFLVEGQRWIIYQNHRLNDGIGLNGISPKEKLEQLGIYNAEQICNFPCLILEDFFKPFEIIFNDQKSQNVLYYYLSKNFAKLKNGSWEP
jgi:hypothetical protein